ncbi:GNAT family N-acetyltransferase [Bifidobacterium pullorum subsp. saeculare]|uniref:GNAT family N-acetyltransferase n=1 Tax=Bifidobacterium pullorum subsp. saeculare TaxID=78257 RepID=A0A939BA68_9BIFI|nr:GNAT family protein [Bifidobacterium pullorum]MBM6700010.1 GNAT family N-acetyltransferase [Bifidobacterium pullorum subsp. saeculare]
MSVLQHLRTAFAPAKEAIRPPCIDAPAGAAPLRLRPMTMDDAEEWNALRWANDAWLAPWESGDPMGGHGISFHQWIANQRRNEQRGTGVTFLIERQGTIVGQISIGAIVYGAMRTGVVGYWVDRDQAGHGYAPQALAMLADWAFSAPDGPRLHRLEIAIVPENQRSLAVVRKVGAHHEGLRPKYMYVNGQWRDHETFCLLAEDMGQGFSQRFVSRHTWTGGPAQGMESPIVE